MKKMRLALAGIVAMLCLSMSAQVTLKGIGHNNRYDDGDQMVSTYLGWNTELQRSIFIVDNGLYSMTWNGSTLTTPVKDPAVVAADIKGDNAKELWASNFNMMYGNSGAAYVDGRLVTIMSRDEQSTVDEELFAVRKWDAATGNLLSTEIRPKSATLECAGMSYNPIDGKVYGLFYLTGQQLPSEITDDPDYFEDEDSDMTDGDAGYCICTIDLATMTVTPITKGLYYYNFITFAINCEGRAFALTSGGSSGYYDDNGKLRDANNKLAGAQLCEFDLSTGLMYTKAAQVIDEETGEQYTEQVNIFDHGTGYSSQYRRQAACFSKSDPDKMYWVGYVNSGKGINEWGSWSSLSDKDWRTNGKYDTALYEVDIITGEATMLAKIDNRWTFSALWVDGDDPSDDAKEDPFFPGGSEPADGPYIALQHADNGSIWQQVEIGKLYSYYIEPAEGWAIHSASFNGSELTVEDNTVTTPAISAQYNRLIVIFEPALVTGVKDEVNSSVKVLGSANGIHITNAAAGTPVYVYTADGRLMHSERLKAASADIALKRNTLYIIKVGNKTVKVRL